MSHLIVALTDLEPPREGAPPPPLPSLERLLARAGEPQPADADWRRWLQGAVGLGVAREELPLARIARGEPGAWSFATPVHLLPTLDQVHLDPEGLLVLSADERALLSSTFNAEFAAAGVVLEFDAAGHGYWRWESLPDARWHEPGRLLGRAIGDWLPQGADAAWVQRLLTEVQMWLHAHPLNDERTARGAKPVNALWPWGWAPGEPPRAFPPKLPSLWSGDPYFNGLWRLAGIEPSGIGEAATMWLGAGERRVAATLTLAGVGSGREALDYAEHHWFGAIRDALRLDRITEMQLWVHGRVYVIEPRSQKWRVWRKPRPWHEVLA